MEMLRGQRPKNVFGLCEEQNKGQWGKQGNNLVLTRVAMSYPISLSPLWWCEMLVGAGLRGVSEETRDFQLNKLLCAYFLLGNSI